MASIYNNFVGLHKQGKPVDFLATWRKTFDKATEKEVTLFQKMYCDDWFDFNTPQMSLTAEGIMGKYHLRFMATLIGDEAPTPLRRSDGFDIWTKEIPRFGHKFPMPARTYRKLQEVYENPHITEADKVKAIEKTLRSDMQDAYLGVKDTQDFIILQALSNWGVAQFKPEINNPGGRVFEVDYQMDAANKLVSVYNWSTDNIKSGKIHPILALGQLCADLRNRGIDPGEILMTQDLYYWLRMNADTRLLVHGTDKKDTTVTVEQLNAALADNQVPSITVITRKMGMDKDGKRKPLEPWNHNFIAIKPSGKIGEIQPAIEDNALMEEKNVDYMDAGNGIRIAKWTTGDSTNQAAAEITQGSGRLIPIITEINGCISMQVRGITEKTVTAKDDNGDLVPYITKAEYDAISETPEG